MIDVDVTERGYTRAKRHMVAGVALWLALGVSGAASATTLQDMFNGGSFTQDGLTFSNFNPVLNANFSPTTILQDLQQPNPDPQALAAQMFDFGPAGVFSRAWVWGGTNPAGADAGQIDLTVLEDDQATLGVDPGFSLAGNSQWHVDAGYSTPNDSSDDLATAQLSAFSYEVSTSGNPINSAEIEQSSIIDAVGPDIFSLFPFAFPDVAGGFAFQFILDQGSTDVANALMNYTLESGIQTAGGVITSPFDQSMDWEGFTDHSAITVVNVIGLAATSGGGFTLSELEQRIDPPQPPNDIPEPGVLLLMSAGMLGAGALRRRKTARHRLEVNPSR